MRTYRCPHCRSEIPIAEINVAADVALCRGCGQASPFSRISGVAELDFAQLETPLKGVTITPSMPGGTEIVYRRFSKIVFILIPFMAMWSGISLSGIYGRQISRGRFDLGDSLFGLPFLIGTLVLLSVILFLLFGKWRVRLDGGRGEVFVGIGPLGWTRRFSYERASVVSLELSTTQRNHVPQRVISIQTGSEHLKFGTVIPDDAKRYIAAAIAKECATV